MMVVLTLLVGLAAALVPATAQAAEDTVRELSVNYDIQSDGSVAVRYELAWRFGSEGRHGIDFGIATRELWDADATQDVVYDVSEIQVSSPSGAPDSFTQTTNEQGSVGSVDLRIGDPEETVEGRDATYVISYVVRGALRTFNGTPELFVDVTSEDYPLIEEFSVSITAPGGVQEARCLVGESDCGADVTIAGGAVLTGSDVSGGTIISAVAALEPGAVSDAEPILEKRRIEFPIMTGITSVVEVGADGMTHVEQELTYLVPDDTDDHPPTLHWNLPLRRPFSRSKDQVFHISNLRVEGAAEVEEHPLTDREESETHQDMKLDVRPKVSDGTSRLTLSYDVAGAVETVGDTAEAQWILAPVTLGAADAIDFIWTMPGGAENARCTAFPKYRDERRECFPGPALETTGDTVSWRRNGEKPIGIADAWIVVDVPAVSVGNAAPILVPGLKAVEKRDRAIGIGGGLAALAGTTGLLVFVSRVRVGRDRRWADVAPGLSAPVGAPVRPARRDDIVPVRFDEPDCSLALAGLVLDGRPSHRHTAAVLIHMAVQGAVKVQSNPLKVMQVTSEPLTEPLEKNLFNVATRGDTSIDEERRRRMGRTVDVHQKTLLRDSQMFVAGGAGANLPLYRTPKAWALAAIAVVFLVLWLFIPGWLGSHGFFVVAGAVGGSVLGLSMGQEPQRALEPGGTALRDQVQGFRQYIATTEANQLNFEADRDIYRRYLPWAVLFDLTERWTQVCQQLAEAGRIPALDTSFWIGARSAAAIADDMSSFHRPLGSAAAASPSPSSGFFSGGGSGGSSGFSGGSSSGGGGGGTRASSW